MSTSQYFYFRDNEDLIYKFILGSIYIFLIIVCNSILFIYENIVNVRVFYIFCDNEDLTTRIQFINVFFD